jgi:hypothetical protein
MIEFSSDAVMGSTTEAIALLLILLVFALLARYSLPLLRRCCDHR